MIGVGIAGAGYFGALHAGAIAAVPGLELRAVSAGSAASTAAFAARHGGRPCADWRDLVGDPAVDAVLVAMPHHLHTEVAIAAARAGKHLLVEKPMAPTLAECQAITRAAAAAGTQLMVGQIMRYGLPCMAAHRYLATGALGRPLYGRSSMVKFWMEHNRRDWHLTPETGGGMMLTAGIHALDRLVWLMGAPVASVAAMSGHLFHDQPAPDTDLLLLRFGNGALGEVCSIGNRDRTTWNSTELSCEGGTLLLDFDQGVRILRNGTAETLPASTEPDWMLRALEREWQDLAAAITTGTPPTAGAAEGTHLIACIEAAQHAGRERREVAVE
jgi:predicted dehydrogenase